MSAVERTEDFMNDLLRKAPSLCARSTLWRETIAFPFRRQDLMPECLHELQAIPSDPLATHPLKIKDLSLHCKRSVPLQLLPWTKLMHQYIFRTCCPWIGFLAAHNVTCV